MLRTPANLTPILCLLAQFLLVFEVKSLSEGRNNLCGKCSCSSGVTGSLIDCTARNLERIWRNQLPKGARYIDLTNNPIICDCALVQLLRDENLQVAGKCARPVSLAGRDLALLEDDDVGCVTRIKRRPRRSTLPLCTPGSKDCVELTCDRAKYWLPIATYWGCCKGKIHDLRASFCTSNHGEMTCIASDFRCKNQHCLPQQWVCNGQNDCQDGSDEIGCGACKNMTASFRCRNNRCVLGTRVCDTYNDCGDGSDETFCRKSNGHGWCGVHDFRCANDQCAHVSKVCNGENDCSDASDEVGCLANTATNCEPGWTYYKGSCYKAHTVQSPWQQAQTTCRSEGANLIKVNSYEVLYFALSSIKFMNGTWIGLSRRDGSTKSLDGAFFWTDREVLGGFAPWGNGEPNNIGEKENCVAMENTTSKWRDEDCSTKLGFICDKVASCMQPCQNGGECTALGCECKSDWSGPDCTYKPPMITSLQRQDTITVKYGTEVTYPCQTTGLPRPAVGWLINGQAARDQDDVTIERAPYKVNVTLRIWQTTELQCRAKSRGGLDIARVRILVQDEGLINVNVSIRLIGRSYSQSLIDPISLDTVALTTTLHSAVKRVYRNASGYRDSSVIRFRSGSVIADLIVRLTRGNLTRFIRDAVRAGNLGGMRVDPGHFHIQRIEACPPEFYNVTWYATPGSGTRVQHCPSNATGIGRRMCGVSGTWEYPDYTDCVSANIQALHHKLEGIVSLPSPSPAQVSQVLVSLAALTKPKEGESQMGGNIRVSTQILHDIVDYNEKFTQGAVNNTDNIQRFLQAASNLLDANNKQQLLQLQKSNSTVTTLAMIAEKFGTQVAEGLGTNERKSKQFVTSNLVLGVELIPAGLADTVSFPNYSDSHITANPSWREFGRNYIVLPRSAFTVPRTANIGSKVASVVYRTLSSFLAVKSAYAVVGGQFRLSSSVISTTLKPAVQLRDPVTMSFDQVKNASEKTPACVFWDYNLNANTGGWSRDGCRLSSSDSDDVTCVCDHLTNFAVLVDMSGSGKGSHEFPLRVITIVGCTVSLVGLVLTLSVHFLFWRNLKCDKTVAHVNLCAALLLANVVLLAGLDRTENKIACTVVSVLLHYLFLCAVCWMLVEGLQMYYSIVLVFALDRTRKYFYLLGWGIPLVIVGVSMAVTQMKGYGGEQACWLSTSSGLIWAFIGPLLFVILANFIIFVRVLRAILTTQKMLTADEKQKVRVAAKCSAVLLPLLGLTWLLGVLAVDRSTVVFLYLFAICNSLQGFFVFLLHCLFDQQVRQAVIAWMQRRERAESASASRAFSLSVNAAPSMQKRKKVNRTDIDKVCTSSDASASKGVESGKPNHAMGKRAANKYEVNIEPVIG